MYRLTIPLMLSVGVAHAALVGQIDTFDTGTANWDSSYTSVTTVSADGPGGVDDTYMELSVSEFHLGAANRSQWSGNYLAEGITSIEMDLNYLAGPDPANVRLMIWGDGGVWGSSSITPVSTGWSHYSFSLAPEDLVLVSLDIDRRSQGTASGVLNDTLSTVNTLLFRNDSEIPTIPGSHPPHITATIGVDNIEAIPEPGTLALLLFSGGGIYLARGRRRKKPAVQPMARCRRKLPVSPDRF